MYWHVLFVLTSVIFPHAHLMYWQAVFSPMYVVCKINVLTCYPSHKRDNRDIRGHDHILVCIWQIGLVSVLDETLHIEILCIFFMPNVFSYCYVNKASKVFKFCVFPAMMDHITPVHFDLGVNSFISLERKDNINTGILVNSIIGSTQNPLGSIKYPQRSANLLEFLQDNLRQWYSTKHILIFDRPALFAVLLVFGDKLLKEI